MNLITEDWRLKLLAVGLAVLMLGAVAFAQNPTTNKTLTVTINYVMPNAPNELVVINYPTTVKVSVTGLTDAFTSVTDASVFATLDLTKASPGPSVPVNLSLKAPNGIKIVNPPTSIALNIDRKSAVSVPVTVRTLRQAPGWEVTKREARCPSFPCVANFTGPSTWEANLTAYADFPSPVENPTNDVFAQPIILLQNGSPLDLTRRTLPQAGLDVSTAAIHVEAKTGSSSRQAVLVDAPPSHGPPPGYRVTNITIDPIQVLITGQSDTLAKINTIVLPAVDLSNSISDVTFNITIPYPNGTDGPVQVARVKYSIAQNPNAQPTPT
jgi:YbbR domain-containing protein